MTSGHVVRDSNPGPCSYYEASGSGQKRGHMWEKRGEKW